MARTTAKQRGGSELGKTLERLAEIDRQRDEEKKAAGLQADQRVVRKMPDPWFRAQPMANMLKGLALETPARKPKDGERRLGRFILPGFQRPSVWTLEQKVRLIESLWLSLPIGALVYNETSPDNACDEWLLDGQQRLAAIVEYLDGCFSVFGYRFNQLDEAEQRSFLLRPVSVLMTRIEDEAGCRDVYERLAYGGTAHS